MDSARGQLLIAGPRLQDPNFWRTVVLVVEHSEAGALGLVLNRPSGTAVVDAVPQLAALVVDDDEEVLVGGPVAQSAVIVLADFEDPDDAALLAFDHVGVLGSDSAPGASDDDAMDGDDAGMGDAGISPERAGGDRDDDTEQRSGADPTSAVGSGGAGGAGLRRTRVFAGHSGWGPGQLDGELARGDWILEPARYSDAFAAQPDSLWESVLERKGGSYALVARMPADPSLN
ncbi:MAG: YqgE/AlgH family protein [Solirubrobacteraceae bacterium]